jgi:hypothetical protein
MAWDVAAEVLLPKPGIDKVLPSFRQSDRESLWVRYAEPGAFRDGLNATGWFDDEEVVAAGMVTQGKAQSLLAMVTGWALVELARGRRCKALPREFVLAVTGDRIVALAVSPWKEGDGESVIAVRVKRDERGSWPLASVRIEMPEDSMGGTLSLPGLGDFPVIWHPEPETQEVMELLAR